MRWVENHLDSSARRAEVSRFKSGWLVVTSNMPQGLILSQIMLKGFITILDVGMGWRFMDNNKLEVGRGLIR